MNLTGIAKAYMRQIKRGDKTIDEVPIQIRVLVQELLNKEK